MPSTRIKYLVLLLTISVIFPSFKSFFIEDPDFVCVKGRILDFKTKKTKRNFKFQLSNNEKNSLDDDPVTVGLGEYITTNKKGEFFANYTVSSNLKQKKEIWLLSKDYADVKIEGWNNLEIKNGDTLALEDIHLISYENELKEEKYNIPSLKKESKKNEEKSYSINEIKTLFSNDTAILRLRLNSIDTIRNEITRLNFGPNKLRGTIDRAYKKITFKLELKNRY